jgi:hypothetical protein
MIFVTSEEHLETSGISDVIQRILLGLQMHLGGRVDNLV